MKIKKILSVVGLSLFAVVSVGAGVALAKAPKAQAANASEDDTWMTHFSFDIGEIATHEGFQTDSMYLHTYREGVGDDKYFQMYPIESGSKVYVVNATFTDGYTYDRVQFKHTESAGVKWAAPYSYSGSKALHDKHVYCDFGTWNGGENWTFSLHESSLYVKNGDVEVQFQEDPKNNRFVARNVYSDGSIYYTFYYRQSWNYALVTLTDVDADRDNPNSNFSYTTAAWCNLKEGTYDVILKNDNVGNGILEFKKYNDQLTDIYLVGSSENISPDIWVYTFSESGDEQFGEFPGTQLKEMTYHKIVPDIRFQDKGVDVYYLPLAIGYPSADHLILAWKNAGGYIGNQSADMLLVPGSAYWFSYEDDYHNDDAGEALTFLWNFDNYRKSATDESICSITKEQAEDLVDRYNNLSSNEVRSVYVDCSTVNTWKDAEKDEKQYTRVDAMMKVVEGIAGVPLVGGGRIISNNTSTIESGSLIAIVSIIGVVSLSAVAILVVIKKRKHE